MWLSWLELNYDLEDKVEKLDLEVGKWEWRMAEQKEEFWDFDNYEVTTAVLDLLSGFIAENKKHSHVLLKSLLTGFEEKHVIIQ